MLVEFFKLAGKLKNKFNLEIRENFGANQTSYLLILQLSLGS